VPLSTSDYLEVIELREGLKIKLGSTSINIFSSVTSDTEGLHIDIIEQAICGLEEFNFNETMAALTASVFSDRGT